ncbi:peroxisomal leader peptide-processing protease-like [Patiria miniata]|uniref:Peroxisomal leader peptide-processing protease n=1 Tax=Patiria miniata TaxID=46514 RepID=A0A913Z1N6_PATMI|nr:peroxisomal leader peptide-processing protease-like [Patiria miniata]XP_038045734.1 peroxisomal leader peptide-processing protease-like [Patiria miniata]
MDSRQIGLADSCVVRVHSHKSFRPGNTTSQSEYSCSGVVIDPQNGLVLTSGQVFSEVVNQGSRGPILSSRRRGSYVYFTAKELKKNVCIDVILSQPVQPHLALLPASSSTKRIPSSSHNHSNLGTRTKRAELVLMWKCQEFDNVLQTIVPEKDGWKFTDSGESDGARTNQSGDSNLRSDPETDSAVGQCVEPCGLSSVSKNLPGENFISWFALLKVGNDCNDSGRLGHALNAIRPSTLQDSFLQQGDPICLQTTPFGATCPAVFLNSISKGIVSNLAGPRHQLVMTDARCIPGSEGGGMYATRRGKNNRQESVLAGVIVAPLCWKNNEWIGLTLVCSIQAILESLRSITDSPPTKKISPAPALPEGSKSSRASPPSTVQQCMRSVVLIKVAGVWGSGVVIDAERGIILTCRHVVQKATNHHVRVRIDWPYICWEDATVVHTTSPTSPFDLAVLKLEGDLGALKEAHGRAGIGTARSYSPGQSVIIVGHALLSPELDLLPSVSSGVMSKVITANGAPVMLQSTCAVHAGASGGAIFCNGTGQLLGIVTSNARDMDTGASFPHINFSVPWTFIGPILNEYQQTEDVSGLYRLDADDDQLTALWNLDSQGIAQGKTAPQTLSKL